MAGGLPRLILELPSLAMNAEAFSRVALVPSVGTIFAVIVRGRRVFVLVFARVAGRAAI